MTNNKDKKKHQYMAGLFILLSLLFLLFGLFWLKNFQLFSAMKVIAKFENPGPLMKGVQVYFRGLNIGKITDLKFAKDYENILVELSIFKKDIQLPENIIAKVKQEGMTGQKYIDLTPYTKTTDKFLSNGDIIKGRSIFSFSDLSYYLQEQAKSGKFEKLTDNLEFAVGEIGELASDLNKFTKFVNEEDLNFKAMINDATTMMSDLSKSAKGFSKIGTEDEFWQDLRYAIKNINKASENIGDISGQMKNNKVVDNLSYAIKETGCAAKEINEIVAELRCRGVNEDIIASIVHNIDDTSVKVSCFSNELNKLMSQRFLLLRLMFGKPGAEFGKCENEICKCKKNYHCPQNTGAAASQKKKK